MKGWFDIEKVPPPSDTVLELQMVDGTEKEYYFEPPDWDIPPDAVKWRKKTE